MSPKHERDLCANCDRWREEHYDNQDAWVADQPCSEYDGITPGPERRKKKDKETAYLYDNTQPIPGT